MCLYMCAHTVFNVATCFQLDALQRHLLYVQTYMWIYAQYRPYHRASDESYESKSPLLSISTAFRLSEVDAGFVSSAEFKQKDLCKMSVCIRNFTF